MSRNIFQSDVDELPDCDDGTPAMADTWNRMELFLREWRDKHQANDDPIWDKDVAEFQIRDMARLFYEANLEAKCHCQIVRL
jgi:hypothetical protein